MPTTITTTVWASGARRRRARSTSSWRPIRSGSSCRPTSGGRGWVGVRLDVGDVDWDEIGELVEDAYRTIATKRLIAALDARRDG